MEIAVDRLEALINEAEVSFNSILLQVEMEIAKRTSVQLKFDEILPCTEELGEELEEIKRKADELTKTEEELKCKVDKELDTLCKKIMDLQSKSGCKSENSSKIVATVLKSRMDNLEVV